MTEIDKIFEKHSELLYGDSENLMRVDQFKSALTEVIEKIRVTDDEIENKTPFEITKSYRFGAKWSRDLQKEKLEKLLNP